MGIYVSVFFMFVNQCVYTVLLTVSLWVLVHMMVCKTADFFCGHKCVCVCVCVCLCVCVCVGVWVWVCVFWVVVVKCVWVCVCVFVCVVDREKGGRCRCVQAMPGAEV